VLANLNPFRGAEPDSGTCVEIGYALALGKPVVGYAADLLPLRERTNASGPGADGRYRDVDGMVVEDFGLPLNLMLAVPVRLEQGGIWAALRSLAEPGPILALPCRQPDFRHDVQALAVDDQPDFAFPAACIARLMPRSASAASARVSSGPG
jgi:hypothetical protein